MLLSVIDSKCVCIYNSSLWYVHGIVGCYGRVLQKLVSIRDMHGVPWKRGEPFSCLGVHVYSRVYVAAMCMFI